ncbi:MAG: DNA repair protein RadA [Bacteroidales bacterium]|nr:DNA repair protein RadA [Bacteroidales bacterium]
MAKTKTVFICQNCGAEAPKWVGKCPSCDQWNTYIEEVITKISGPQKNNVLSSRELPQPLKNFSAGENTRIPTSIGELNRVLGGGLVPGSVVLLGGEPGIGKSTLALQLALLSKSKILYISGEESGRQIKMRAERLSGNNDNCYILNEVQLEIVLPQIEHLKPELVIIDSIQTMYTEALESIPGSISQVRECAALLLRYAKQSSTPVILIGHITKDGNLAGPKVLEHLVDTVLQFEGDSNYNYRVLRAFKNRFGSTSELGIFQMFDNGLVEVENPSEILLSHNYNNLSGIAIGATVDGIRPFLIEIQALVSSAAYGTPQRSTTGFDARRLNMLLAVLEKRAGFHLTTKDVFLNIAGGLRINDPGIDLAVISAILSSNVDRPVTRNICFAAEVGLSGEIRPVNRIEQRVKEADKIGFKKILISNSTDKKQLGKNLSIEIIAVDRVDQAVKFLFT